jgi:RNA polymerase sigma-70 factor (ECF subfamily)
MEVLGENREDARDAAEITLVRRAQSGDADAFGELNELHVDRVYRYVVYRVDDVPEAEDLSEQVFLKAWEAMPRYEDRGLPFRAWLLRLAHNLVIDHYRARRAAICLDTMTDGELHDLEGASACDGPESELVARHDSAELVSALDQLGDDQRQVVLLRFVEGLSHAEVATVIGKSEGATRAIQHRAVLALGRPLGALRGTDGAESCAPDRARPESSRTRLNSDRGHVGRPEPRRLHTPIQRRAAARRLESPGGA